MWAIGVTAILPGANTRGCRSMRHAFGEDIACTRAGDADHGLARGLVGDGRGVAASGRDSRRGRSLRRSMRATPASLRRDPDCVVGNLRGVSPGRGRSRPSASLDGRPQRGVLALAAHHLRDVDAALGQVNRRIAVGAEAARLRCRDKCEMGSGADTAVLRVDVVRARDLHLDHLVVQRR